MNFSGVTSSAIGFVKAWPWKELLSGVVGAFLSAALVLMYQRHAERIRREPGLGVRLVFNDIFIVAYGAGISSGSANVTVTGGGAPSTGSATQPQSPPPAPTPPPPPMQMGHTVHHLLLRNLAERPAGIVDFKLLRRDGSAIPVKRREYLTRLGFPLVLKAWDVQSLKVQIDDSDLTEATTIVLVDMDDKELHLPFKDEASRQRWFGYSN